MIHAGAVIALVCAAGLLAGALAPGEKARGAPVLPDIEQQIPASLRLSPRADRRCCALGFDSAVINRGPGTLRMRGERGAGDATMVADQLIEAADEGWIENSRVGTMRYVDRFGHEHWHVMGFQRYELRSADGRRRVARDRKQGFCINDPRDRDWCGRARRMALSVESNLPPGIRDVYPAFLEGQEIELDQRTMPSGRYLLVNRTDETHLLREARIDNNRASALIEIDFSRRGADGYPIVRVLRGCKGADRCPAAGP